MTLEAPQWQQDRTYSARQDRQLIRALWRGGVVDFDDDGLRVSQRSAGANFTVDVAAGQAVVPGTSQADQGSYLCTSTAAENIDVPPAPGSGARVDLVVARVRDSQISGGDDDWRLEVIEGTAGSDPVAPAVPDDAVGLAEILVDSSDAAVTDDMITDVRDRAAARSSDPNAARIAAGTYVGDGSSSRHIGLPFTPAVVFVISDDVTSTDNASVGWMSSFAPGERAMGWADQGNRFVGPQIADGGFEVGASNTNEDGDAYRYVAFG